MTLSAYNTMLATAAILISLAALLLSVWQFRKNRPVLFVRSNSNMIDTGSHYEEPMMLFEVINRGLQPTVVQVATLQFRGIKDTGVSERPIVEVLLNPALVGDSWPKRVGPGESASIAILQTDSNVRLISSCRRAFLIVRHSSASNVFKYRVPRTVMSKVQPVRPEPTQ